MLSHQVIDKNILPETGYVLGLVTGVDFWAQLSVLLCSEVIRTGIDASSGQFLWVLSSYAAAGVLTLPLIERASRRWHYRQLMLFGIMLCVFGALFAVLSKTLWQLAIARLFQGLGGGGLFTMSRVYLQLVTPQAARPVQLRSYIYGLMISVAPLPMLAAVLTKLWGWQAVFVLQAIFGLLVLGLVKRFLQTEHHTPQSLGNLDWLMAISFATGIVLLLHGLMELEFSPWRSSMNMMFLPALISLAFAIWRAQTHPDPLLKLGVLNGARYLTGLAFYALYYFINGAVSYLYPRLFGEMLGLDLQVIGTLQSFTGVITVLGLPIYFRYASKWKDRRVWIALGFICASTSLLWLEWVFTHAASWLSLIGPMILKGLFPILGVVQIAGLTYTEVAHQDFAHAYVLKNIVRLVAGVIGAVFVGQYLQLFARPEVIPASKINPELLPMHDLMTILAVVSTFGALLIFRQNKLR
jgi:predicted MFS family arabinose efflux permease